MSWDNVGPNQCHMDGTPIRNLKYNHDKPEIHRELKMEEEHDFGFSFSTEEELTVIQEDTEKVEKLRAMIMPLLVNLKKDPDKDIIKWKGADRVKSIDSFIKKMNKLIDG